MATKMTPIMEKTNICRFKSTKTRLSCFQDLYAHIYLQRIIKNKQVHYNNRSNRVCIKQESIRINLKRYKKGQKREREREKKERKPKNNEEIEPLNVNQNLFRDWFCWITPRICAAELKKNLRSEQNSLLCLQNYRGC